MSGKTSVAIETNSALMVEGHCVLAAGPLSEINQPKPAKAKKSKHYRRTTTVPKSSNHYSTGDSYIGEGQENRRSVELKNQWIVGDAAFLHRGSHQVKGGGHREKKKLPGKQQHFCSEEVQVMSGESCGITRDVRNAVSEPHDGYPAGRSANSLCWVPVHKLNSNASPYFSSRAEAGKCRAATTPQGHGLKWRCPLVNSSQHWNAGSAGFPDEQKGVPRLSLPHPDEFHPRCGLMNPTTHSAANKSFHGYMYGKPCLAFDHGGYTFRDNSSCQAKWVPVAAEASQRLQNVFQGTNFSSHSTVQIPCRRTGKVNIKGKVDVVCVPATLVHSKSSGNAVESETKRLQKACHGTKFTSQGTEQIPCRWTGKMNTNVIVEAVSVPATLVDSKRSEISVESDRKRSEIAVESETSKRCETVTRAVGQKSESLKNGGAHIEKPKETDEFVGSLPLIQALTAAYKQQLLSEIIQFTLGYPLADFETFLKSSSPVITSSISSVCNQQIQSVSLSGLWNWYENPGCYGLKVKIEGGQYLNGFMDEQTAFDAHFVPSLSAIQLFGYPVHLKPEGKSQGPVDLGRKDTAGPSSSAKLAAKSDSTSQRLLFSNVFQCTDHGNLKLISSSPCSSNPELLFEFFESEQPYNRKPLHLKIMELTESGTSNRQGYGDPQKLLTLALNELHPASWFSVAWYPIYRIPEGKLQSSFLTYHSLGHYVSQGAFPDIMTSQTLFPAVGLQSYRTKGECWFNLKRRVKPSPEQSAGDSEILKRRLQTLEKNASLLARGCVSKDGIKVNNWQSDYEFFVSRKC